MVRLVSEPSHLPHSSKSRGTGDPLVTLDQNTSSGAFINFEGTSAANTSNSISTLDVSSSSVSGPDEGTWLHVQMARIQINGTDRWLAVWTEL